LDLRYKMSQVLVSCDPIIGGGEGCTYEPGCPTDFALCGTDIAGCGTGDMVGCSGEAAFICGDIALCKGGSDLFICA
jgi:hypothetical protein